MPVNTQQLIEDHNALQIKHSEVLDALSHLCALKRYKDKHGKTAEYESSKEIAWKQAFKLTGT